jgi:hypothetical protein
MTRPSPEEDVAFKKIVADYQKASGAAGVIANPVQINAGGEQIRASVTHDARDQKGRFGRRLLRCSAHRDLCF